MEEVNGERAASVLKTAFASAQGVLVNGSQGQFRELGIKDAIDIVNLEIGGIVSGIRDAFRSAGLQPDIDFRQKVLDTAQFTQESVDTILGPESPSV